MANIVALIPARGGSERVPNKNTTRLFCGHPLLAYCIEGARQSGIFSKILVSSQDISALSVAAHYGADVIKRPDNFGTGASPDIEWLTHTIETLERQESEFDSFALLRLVNPFRTAATIQRAYAAWQLYGEGYDSLRAVERCHEHPGKMWRIINNTLVPVLLQPEPQPWHSSQYKTLPAVYVQNASLEIAWKKTVTEKKSLAGDVVLPFITEGAEGFDINTLYDWETGERMVASGEAALPGIGVPTWA